VNKLTCRERLKRVFRCEPVDRMPVRIWGVDPMFPANRIGWEHLYEMTERHELDLFRNWSPSAEEQDPPACQSRSERRDSDKPGMWESTTVLETPAGDLTLVTYQPKDGSPGYRKKRYIETVDDARKWLSIPSQEPAFGCDSYSELERKSGDRALLMIGLAEPMYAVNVHMGSELFGYWLADERELLHEMISHAYEQIMATVKHYLHHGVGDAFGWCGPELCIPPLASPRDFREFVSAYDKPIIDLVHDAGKLFWVHCHGDMGPVLDDFMAMDVDCLNPIEPPPMGSLTLGQLKSRVQGRMAVEGGVQDGDFDLLAPGAMVPVVEDAVQQLKPGGGYILCPTSAPTTWVGLSDQHVAHYRDFIETGVRLRDYA